MEVRDEINAIPAKLSPRGQDTGRLLPKFEDLVVQESVAERTEEISNFTFSVYYQKNGALTNHKVAEAILGTLLNSLSDILIDTGIHHLDLLEASTQTPSEPGARLDGDKAVVSVALNDSVFKFGITVFDDRFRITREGSSFHDFFEWYQRLMPNAAQLEATVRQAAARTYGQSIEVTHTNIDFRFIFSDFHKEGWRPNRPPRNIDVLSKLVPAVPTRAGLTELSDQDFLRIDLKFSRIEKFATATGDKLRNCWYTLEAPSNERGRFLVFTAALRNVSGETIEASSPGSSNPIPFDPDFTGDYLLAVTDFLIVRALGDFMGRVLEDWKFSTERQL